MIDPSFREAIFSYPRLEWSRQLRYSVTSLCWLGACRNTYLRAANEHYGTERCFLAWPGLWFLPQQVTVR